ncbi:MAG: DUF2567 domain-containing protein [Mycobacteriaceae bacterium]
MRARTERSAAVQLVLVLLVVGALVGLGWALLVPGLGVGILRDGTATVLAPESKSRFDATGQLAVALLVVGLAAGVLTWTWRRWRGPTLLVALVLGSFAAGCLAELVGQLVGGLRFPVQGLSAGTRTTGPPELGTWAIALLQPVGACLAYTLAAALSSRDDPRGDLVDARAELDGPSLSSGPSGAGPVPAGPESPAAH